MTDATGQSGGDVITAALLQITRLAERLAIVEQREASHHGETASAQKALLDSLSRLDQQIAAIADQFTEFIAGRAAANEIEDEHGARIRTPRWWRLDGDEREQDVAALRAWVEQVYRPSYGHLAAMLGSCWEQHPLCLSGLHLQMELWSVLYLEGEGMTSTLASQAEWHYPAPACHRRADPCRDIPMPSRQSRLAICRYVLTCHASLPTGTQRNAEASRVRTFSAETRLVDGDWPSSNVLLDDSGAVAALLE